MSVRLRFTRIGRPHDPYYRLVAIDKRQARDAKPIEVLGTVNPRDKKNPQSVKIERLQYWIGVGAPASESVVFTLKNAGIWNQVKAPNAAKVSVGKSAATSAKS